MSDVLRLILFFIILQNFVQLVLPGVKVKYDFIVSFNVRITRVWSKERSNESVI